MRGTIQQLDSLEVQVRSFFRTRTERRTGYFVQVRAELTEEEKNIVQQRKIGGHIIFEVLNPDYVAQQKLAAAYDPHNTWEWRMKGKLPDKNPYLDPDFSPPRMRGYSIADFAKGFNREFDTPGEAKNWAAEAREYLKKIKDIIDHNATFGKNETFDL